MKFAGACLFLVSLLCSSSASADQYCFTIKFKSDYENCPGNTTSMFWEPACTFLWSVPERSPRKLVVELWDKDNTNSDDFIGEYTLNPSTEEATSFCLGFTWDGVARGEAAPDVYLRTRFEVRDGSGSSFSSKACESDNSPNDSCSNEAIENWRNYAVTNCVSCTSPVTLVFNSDPAGYYNRIAMVMHSAAAFEDRFASSTHRQNNHYYWIDGDACSGACVYAQRKWISMPLSSARRWGTPTHEAGHLMHKQALDENGFPGQPCGCSGGVCNPNGHSMTGASNERCATTEGFAHYIHAVSWWNPSASASRPEKDGYSIEGGGGTTSSSCFTNSEIELEVARTFWDYDDSNNEGTQGAPASGDDSSNRPTSSILQVWRDFPNGTANHASDEDEDANPSSTWPEDACNLEDYAANANDSQFNDAMDHNATSCQQTG